MMTRRQAWQFLADQFTQLANGVPFNDYTCTGMCWGIRQLCREGHISWWMRRSMLAELERIHPLGDFWYEVGPDGADARAEECRQLAGKYRA